MVKDIPYQAKGFISTFSMWVHTVKLLILLGLVDYLSTLFFDVWTVCVEGSDGGRDIKMANATLQMLLDTLHTLFKYVSEVVRRALQVGISSY